MKHKTTDIMSLLIEYWIKNVISQLSGNKLAKYYMLLRTRLKFNVLDMVQIVYHVKFPRSFE